MECEFSNFTPRIIKLKTKMKFFATLDGQKLWLVVVITIATEFDSLVFQNNENLIIV